MENKKPMNKKLLAGVLALVLVVAALIGIYFATRPATSAADKTITATVVANGEEEAFTIHTDEEYLRGALAAGLNLGRGSGPLDHTFDLVSRFAQSSESV